MALHIHIHPPGATRDAQAHDPKSGQFTSGSGGTAKPADKPAPAFSLGSAPPTPKAAANVAPGAPSAYRSLHIDKMRAALEAAGHSTAHISKAAPLLKQRTQLKELAQQRGVEPAWHDLSGVVR